MAINTPTTETNNVNTKTALTLRERYNELNDREKKEFRTAVYNDTGKAVSTIYRWIDGEILPSKLEREVIAKALGVSSAELFEEATA